MLLLKLISPKKLPRRRSGWRFHHKCYSALLILLLRRYSRGVIDEVIVLNGVKVSHTLRDEWFESELKRFGIEFAPSLRATAKPSLEKRKYRRSRLFTWKETLSVIKSRRHCSIMRERGITLESNFDGTLKTSSEQDGILAIWLEDDSAITPKEERPRRTTAPKETPAGKTTPVEPPQKKRKIHIKDTVTPQDTPAPKPPTPTLPQEQPADTFTQHKGFEENDIF